MEEVVEVQGAEEEEDRDVLDRGKEDSHDRCHHPRPTFLYLLNQLKS